jgi:hypothetical protein
LKKGAEKGGLLLISGGPGAHGHESYDLAIGFLWPGFQTQIGFFAAVPWANRSASHFRAFLKILNSAAHTVDLQTHSLGARVALQAMSFVHEVWGDNVLLTAPARTRVLETIAAECRYQ